MEETSDVSRFYVYILLSLNDKGFYIGFTANLRDRLSAHANGLVTSTKFRRPVKLIYYEYFINQKDAKIRERFLKSGFGRSQLKKALKETLMVYGKSSS